MCFGSKIKRWLHSCGHLFVFVKILLEVSVQQTLESLSVSCLVLCHLVNSVVDSVKIERL